jgi:hypothetical protein
MKQASVPYLWLGPRWGAWVEFAPDRSRDLFEEVARRLSQDLGAIVKEVLSFPGPDGGKEYRYFDLDGVELLLMWKPHLGTGLGALPPAIPVLVRVGRAFGVTRFVGWRWRLYWAWQWLRSGRAPM